MKRALALIVTVGALSLALVGTASAACNPGYCAAPVVSGVAAGSVTDTGAVVTGTVNPNNSGATGWTITVNGAVIGSGSIPDGTAGVGVSASASGLAPSTTYTATISVSNLGGGASGSTSFTTLASAASGGGGATGGGTGTGTDSGGGTSGGPGASPEQSKTAADNALGTDTKEAAGFSNLNGVLDVFLPDVPNPTSDTPEVKGSAITLAPNFATVQDLFALTCVQITPCEVTVGFSGSGATLALRAIAAATVKLPSQTLALTPGQAGVVKLRLTAAVRKALKAGKTVSLRVTISVTSGGTTKASTKTYKLRAQGAKAAAKKKKTATGKVAPAFTG